MYKLLLIIMTLFISTSALANLSCHYTCFCGNFEINTDKEFIEFEEQVGDFYIDSLFATNDTLLISFESNKSKIELTKETDIMYKGYITFGGSTDEVECYEY